MNKFMEEPIYRKLLLSVFGFVEQNAYLRATKTDSRNVKDGFKCIMLEVDFHQAKTNQEI